MGIHASPTCTMAYEGATGWLIGEENRGLAAMFTMMNAARLQVGVQGVGIAEAAYQKARAYAGERKQGGGLIADHPDVRRMLLLMRSKIMAGRALCYACAVAADSGDKAREDVLTPIAKAWSTDMGVEVASLGVQVHGGMGYVEETGVAQFWRVVRVTAIYEGTNGIQAMDLVGRKMMDGGEAAYRLLEEIEAGAEAARASLPDLAGDVWSAAETLREATEALVGRAMPDRFAGAVPYLRAFARVLGAHFHLRAALAEGGAGPRSALARVHIDRLLPQYAACLAEVKDATGALFDLTPEALAP